MNDRLLAALLELSSVDGVTYQLQYVDYDPGQWTVPVKLNPERMDHIITDASIKNIRININQK